MKAGGTPPTVGNVLMAHGGARDPAPHCFNPKIGVLRGGEGGAKTWEEEIHYMEGTAAGVVPRTPWVYRS